MVHTNEAGDRKVKSKNSELPSSIIWMVFGVVMTACIILYFTNFYNNTIDSTDKIIENSVEMSEDFDEYEITMYEFEEVKGSQVVNFIKKNIGGYTISEIAPFFVRVNSSILGKSYSNEYLNKEHIKDIKNVSAVDYYINPNAFFECEVVRNENKVILGIEFIQK